MSSDSTPSLGTGPAKRRADMLQVDRILHVALLVSHPIYAGLVQFLQLPGSATPTGDQSLGTILLVMSLGAAAAALTLDTVAFAEPQIDKWIDEAQGKHKDPEQAALAVSQRAVPLSLMRWSMASAASILGLLSALTGSLARSTSLLLIAVGALAHLYCQPRQARVQARIADKQRAIGL